MSEQTLSLVASIRERLRATIRRTTLADLTFGGVVLLGILAGAWVTLAAVEAGLWLETTPRAFLFWGAAALLLGLFGYYLLLPALRLAGIVQGPTEEDVAVRIGKRYPEVSDRLVNLLHLTEGRRSDAPDVLVDGAVRMLGEQVHPVSFEKVEDFSRARRAGRLAAIPVVALLFFVLAAPSTFFDASLRLLTPGVHYQRPAPFRLVVEPGSVELAKGAGLEIVVRAAGEAAPRTVTLALNPAGEETVETVTLKPDSTGAFRHRLANVRRSIRYRASAEPVRTAWYDATVTERPLVRGLQLSLAFPSYTGIPPQRLEPNRGDVSALPGTRVTVAVGLGGSDVDQALLRFDGGRVDTLSIDGPTATGTFALTEPGSYQVILQNAGGVRNANPITYTLDLLSDAHPSVVLLNPEPDAALTDEMHAGLHLRMNDDYGFSRLQLAYRLAESRYGAADETFTTMPLPLDAPSELDQELIYDWLLSESTRLDPVPGDVIEYYVQVWDNDAVAGFKSARTGTQRLRLPSLAEQYRQVEEQHDASEQQLEEMLRETTDIRDQFRELRDALRRKQDADWEDRRQLENLQERQEALDQKVEELSRQVESMTQEMQENNLLSPETLEKYQELQKVVEEIQSPELQEALRKLQEAMEELNLQGMQQSIEQFEFSEQQYRERLERTLDLFQKLRAEQELDQAARMAEEIAKQQQRLEEQTRELMGRDPRREADTPEDRQQNEQQQSEQQEGEQQEGEQQQGEQQQGERSEQDEARRADELAREQERSREEMEALEQQLQKLQQQMEQMRNAPVEEMRELNRDLQEQQMPQQMQENSEQLRQQQLDQARQGQQQMQQQMQQLQQQLQQMQQQMQGQQRQVNVAGLRRALSDILTLSQEQERLRAAIRSNASAEASLREDAQQQVKLSENLSTVIDSLQALSREIPQMNVEVQRHAGDALRAMGRATETMTERAANETTGHQKTSMMHLNELALLLSDLLEQLRNMQSGGQGGASMEQMLQQLQQMGEQQQQLNQQMQQFLNDVQGNRLSQDMQERLQQMQAQQDAIRRQLKEMSRNPEARGKLLGDLNKIAEQMQETIEEMRRRQVDRRTVERQEQILSRLLDAQRSMRERGKEKKREGREGEDHIRSSPGELSPAEEADKLRRDLIRALESGYAPDYEELIKRYFELLQRQSQETPEP